jgi:hypothetical protein
MMTLHAGSILLGTILLMFYTALGVVVGMAIAFVQEPTQGRDPFEKLPSAYAGGFGSTLSHLLSTSVWVRFANERRILGLPTDDIGTQIILTLGDHPLLCAILAAVCFYLSALVVRSVLRNKRGKRFNHQEAA